MTPLPEPLPGYVRHYSSPFGGWVDVHDMHGKQEYWQNYPIAVLLADLGECVCLLPVLRIPGIKCADATRDGIAWEFKMPEGQTANAIDKALRGANKQATKVLLKMSPQINHLVLEQAVYGRIRRADNIDEVAILLGSKLHHFTRNEILNNTFRGKLG